LINIGSTLDVIVLFISLCTSILIDFYGLLQIQQHIAAMFVEQKIRSSRLSHQSAIRDENVGNIQRAIRFGDSDITEGSADSRPQQSCGKGDGNYLDWDLDLDWDWELRTKDHCTALRRK